MRHSGEHPYKCPYCSYSSIQCSTYKVHLKSKHPDKSDDKVYNCDQCLFKTVRKETYLTHLAEHKVKKAAAPIQTEEPDTTSEAKPPIVSGSSSGSATIV